MKLRVLLVLVAVATAVFAAEGPAMAATAPTGTPSATHFTGVPYVGAVFRQGLSNPHGCSGSVVQSSTRNLVLTAAHCVSGTGAPLKFAPGYVNGKTPYGVWTVTKAWVAYPWKKTRDQHYDYAFLQVAPAKNGKRVQDLTGAAVLGYAPKTGSTVQGTAYTRGINDQPVRCTNKITYTSGYPTFNCHGYYGGVSGSPLLVINAKGPNTIVGLIGGLYQGGCSEWNSFSSPFYTRIHGTYKRAVSGTGADIVPSAGASGC